MSTGPGTMAPTAQRSLFDAATDLSDAAIALGRAIESGDLVAVRKANIRHLVAFGRVMAEARSSH